jgi:antagonist of KipI
VLRPGLLTTVQDRGRPGSQRHGVVVGGALDDFALRVANLLVGNATGAAGLEITLLGPTLRLAADHLLALGGADLNATLDGEPVPTWRAFAAAAGCTLVFRAPGSGARACLAVAGGVDVPPVLGGRGTDLRAGFGGLDGRPLRAGDTIPVGVASPAAAALRLALLRRGRRVAAWGAGRGLLPLYSPEPVLRVLPGPEHDGFTAASRAALVEASFEVSSQSDRMGYRLSGPRLELADPLELVSSPVTAGTVQVPADGQPIVLMADRQTTGGYPRIAQVITVDLALLAQAPPGSPVRFRVVRLEEAQRLWLERERSLRMFAEAVRLRMMS